MLSTPTCRVYLRYDPHLPSPPQDPSSTRFVCISDTHSRSFNIPPGDVLLHAGDLSSWGRFLDLKTTIDWLASLPHPIKIIIAGNHDLCLDGAWTTAFDKRTFLAARNLVRGPAAQSAGIYYLEHEALEITTLRGHRWKIYGSPAAPRYVEGAFQYEPGPQAREIYSRIPPDTDILLTHTPPYNVHDLTKRGKHAGCRDLAERLRHLESGATEHVQCGQTPRAGVVPNVSGKQVGAWNCRLHLFGHIHEAYGASIKSLPNGERVQVNAAAPFGEPVIVDLFKARQGHEVSDNSLPTCSDVNMLT